MVIETRSQTESLYHYTCEFDAVSVITHFWRRDAEPHPDLVTNFLGTRVPARIHPPILDKMLGRVERPPNPGNWHADIAEWASALRAVRQAKDVFRIIELGCGWGCWLVNTGMAARRQGLAVDLIGVEGNDLHLANARAVLHLNGFDDGEFRLLHGVAAPREGTALFPTADAERSLWNGQAVFYPDDATLALAKADPAVQVLDCYPLEKLGGGKVVDLLHIDIQGAEVAYVRGNLDAAGTYVRRILIGTHSRSIEGALMDTFLEAGWRLEMERPAIVLLQKGRPKTRIDGVQMWVNPRL